MKKLTIQEIDGINVIVVDNEGFDWGLDEDHLTELKKTCISNPHMKDSMIATIQKHFIESFEEFLGRKITWAEINKSLEKGQIE